MNDDPTIEYVPNPKRPTLSQTFNDENVIFGAYIVKFSDGWTVMLPHSGWPNTISATPLDVEDDEHRAILIQHANRMKPVDEPD